MRLFLTLAALSAGVTPLAGQTAAELCERVGRIEVGQWAEYQLTSPQGTMQMRFAIVGKEAVDGKDHYWHEMKAEAPQGMMISQVLIPSFPYDQGDVQGMVMKAGDQPAMRVSKPMLSAMRGMMERGPNPGGTVRDALRQCQAAEIIGHETIEVPAGRLATVHFRTHDEGMEGEGWVSTDVSFGIVKLRWSGKAQGEMILLGHGMGATSSITETPRDMPGMPGRN